MNDRPPTVHSVVPDDGLVERLWLWRNFVDGRPEYWAFDNPFPRHEGGDPVTLGEPCGWALLKRSQNGRPDVLDAEVEAAISHLAASDRDVLVGRIAELEDLLAEYGDRVRMARAEPAEKQWAIDEAMGNAAERAALIPLAEEL